MIPFMRHTTDTDSFAASRVRAHQGDDEVMQYANKLSRMVVTENKLKHIPGTYNVLADSRRVTLLLPLTHPQAVLQKQLMLAWPWHSATLTLFFPHFDTNSPLP